MKKLFIILACLISLSTQAQFRVVAVPSSPAATTDQIPVKDAVGPAWSAKSLKTINSASIIGSGNISLQTPLVSGTDIKTINGSSILGSGDLTVSGGTALNGTGYVKMATTTPSYVASIPQSDLATFTDVDITAANFFGWSGRSRIKSGTDGTITLLSNAETGFTTLQFGGTGSTFGALRTNGTQLEFKAANNTGFTNAKAAKFIVTNTFQAVSMPGSASVPDSVVYRTTTGDFEVRKLPTATNFANTVILSADDVNNNATANTLEDCGNLAFAVTTGNTYRFKFFVVYTAAANTTGSRWTISGPTATALSYYQQYNLDGVSFQWATRTAYDAGNLSSGSTTTAGQTNIAIVEGTVRPSADGTIQLRFASEISSSAITAKANDSYLEWKQIN